MSALIEQRPVRASVTASVATASTNTARINLVIAGARGRVASALRAQLQREQSTLRSRTGIELAFVGAFDRRAAHFDAAGFVFESIELSLGGRQPRCREDVIEQLLALPGPTLFVDATGSVEWAEAYETLLRAGIGVVTPNKRAHAGCYRSWLRLCDAARSAPLRFETTVGAALPVIAALRTIVDRGERVLGIEGVLSGSVSYVLARLQQGLPLSIAIEEAIRLGYTEPDPLEDLDFIDLRRKLLILARETGQRLEPEQIRVESLLPRGATLAGLLAGQHDGTWAQRVTDARANGCKLVAVAQWQLAGQARISVRAEPIDSPLARIAGGENIVRIRTEYHDSIPICISGPGAGPAVTAAGLFGDIVCASRALLAR